MKRILVLLALLSLAGNALASSTFRCGSKLVSLEDNGAEVLHKCGEPASRDLVGYIEVVDEYGFSHELAVEEWIYGPSHGMYHYLRFEGNRLRRIDSKRGN